MTTNLSDHDVTCVIKIFIGMTMLANFACVKFLHYLVMYRPIYRTITMYLQYWHNTVFDAKIKSRNPFYFGFISVLFLSQYDF